MKELNTAIDNLLHSTNGNSEVIESIIAEKTLYPFSTASKLLTYFLSLGELSYEEFSALSTAYSQRNKYLDLYDMAPPYIWTNMGRTAYSILIP